MTDTPEVPAQHPSLEIPKAARKAFAEHHKLPDPDDGFAGAVDWAEVDRDIRAIAAPVVAAELRRIAGKLEARFIGGPIDSESAAYTLQSRADALIETQESTA